MNRIFTKTKSIIALLFVASLLLTFFVGNGSDSWNGAPGSEKSTVISADRDFSPFLPAGETELEKLSSLLQRPAMPARRTFRFDTFSIILLALLCAYAGAFFLCAGRKKSYENADQFHKSVIAYIHHKGDPD